MMIDAEPVLRALVDESATATRRGHFEMATALDRAVALIRDAYAHRPCFATEMAERHRSSNPQNRIARAYADGAIGAAVAIARKYGEPE